MPKAQLTAAFCAGATCPPGKRKIDYWDKIIPDFVLEVRSSGSATYALRFIDEGGKQRQHKIGALGVITFDQARKAARKLRSDVELGGNPAAKKERRKAIPTYGELAEQHLAYARTYQRKPENIERVLRLYLVPRFGKMLITDIRPQDIAEWLAELREGGLAPATVEKIRVTLNRSFELGAKFAVPGAEHNPVRSVPRLKFNNARERYLSSPEAERLYNAVETSSNPLLKVIVGLLLLTGARKMELLKAKWEHVDLERKVWHIPDSKTGKARYVPLSEAAIDLIELLPRWPGCSWLLANPKTRKPYTDITRAWDTAREAAGLPGLRIHDLRHSAASFMINAGIDLYAVGRILGHADHQSTMRYSHLANDTLRAAVEAGAAKLKVDWAGANANG